MRKLLCMLTATMFFMLAGCGSEQPADDSSASISDAAESVSASASVPKVEETISDLPEVSENETNESVNVAVPQRGDLSGAKPENKPAGQSGDKTPAGNKSPAQADDETPENPTPEPEPQPGKSPYDAPFDVEAIRSELIHLGESEMGWTHRTHYQNGTPVQPSNSSWDGNIVANQTIQGAQLKKLLYDYVTLYTDEFMEQYGGEPITAFTIYVEPLGGGSYAFYLLH